jgi:hypothetical protein
MGLKSEAQKMIRSVLSLFCIFVLVVPTANAQKRSRNDWTMLQSLRPGDKISVQLKSDKTIKGEFDRSTDATLMVSVHSDIRSVDRNDVKQVHHISGDSVGKTTLTGTAVGAAAGAVTGAAVGGNCDEPSFGPCFSRGTMAVAGAMLFAIPGAVVGLVLGLYGHHRELIYEA